METPKKPVQESCIPKMTDLDDDDDDRQNRLQKRKYVDDNDDFDDMPLDDMEIDEL
jgi:hypothetical protein